MPTPAGSTPFTPLSGPIVYDPVLSRVRLTITGLTDPVRVDRSTDQVVWAIVRGASSVTPAAGQITVDDYEFAADVANFYRVVGPAEAILYTGSIIPELDGVWLKSLARPFLNRKVIVRDFSRISRPSRSGVFPIVGRSLPIAVTDLQGSRRWTLEVYAETPQEAEALDLLISTGEVQFVHVPTTGRLAAVPGGYVGLGDTSEELLPTLELKMRVFSLPLTQVAAPGPDVVPAVGTWQSVINTYADWSAVLSAHATWDSVLQLVGSPSDVVVP